MFTTLLLAFILCEMHTATSQEPKICCDFERQHKVAIESDPRLRAAFEAALPEWKTQSAADAPGRYIIPVVFHVYGSAFNSGSKVTLQRVEDALKKTSEDFRGMTLDYNQSDPSSRFEEIKKPLNVEFRLAKIDPTGRPCTGVNFYPDRAGFGNGSGYDDEIRKYAWDNTKYMNVYILRDLYNDGDYYNSGVAWLPNAYMTKMNTARVVYNGSYLGINTTENFRRVLTHEFGHFLGLLHTFDGGCAYPNDEIDDTPPVAKPQWPKNTVNCEGKYTDWENFMNYTDAYRHFTTDQVALMEYYLSRPNGRRSLWQPANLVATGVEDGHIDAPAVLATSPSAGFWEEHYDGSVEGTMVFTGMYGRSFAKTGTMEPGVDYVVADLPEGLVSILTIQSNVSATLTIAGAAHRHDKAHSVEDVTVTLKAAMLAGEGEIADESFTTRVMFEDDPDSFCMFDVRWRQYAYIQKIDFAGMVFEPAYDGKSYKNYIGEVVAGFEAAGKTYTLRATVANFDSEDTDPYSLRLWIDWDNNYILSPSELIGTKQIERIGAPGTLHELTFDVTVPQDFPAGTMIGFRLMLHFTIGNEGQDPCGIIDNGDVHDYSAKIGAPRTPAAPPAEYCLPEFQYHTYAYISKVEMNGMENNTHSTSRPGSIESFTEDETKHISLEKGKTYDMRITYRNIDSHPDDTYTVRACIDWNGDDKYTGDESQKKRIDAIGRPEQETTASFSFTVPDHALSDKPLHARAFIHYGSGMAGEIPCSAVENGQCEEYLVFVSESANAIRDPSRSDDDLSLRLENGILRLEHPYRMTGYRLFGIDGGLIRKEERAAASIDMTSYPKGIYILRIKTTDGDIVRKIVLK